jgi:hypothetical protein
MWLPIARDDVVMLPVPPDSVAVPRVAAESRKVTVPPGVPAPPPDADIVAVNVTLCPNTDGLADELTADELFALFTVWVIGAEVLPEKFVSPPYDTVMVWLPAASDDVVKLAVPPASVALPMETPPSLNVTVPVGVLELTVGVTVAVKVTAWPNTDGFTELVTVVVVASRLTVWVIAAEVLALKLPSPL